MKTGCVKHSKEATKAKDAVRFDHFQCLGFVRVSSKNKIKFEKFPAKRRKTSKTKTKKIISSDIHVVKNLFSSSFLKNFLNS